MNQKTEGKLDLIVVKKLWLVLGSIGTAAAAIVIPALSGYAAYSRSLSAVDDKINAVQVEAAKTLVTKADLAEFRGQLNAMQAAQMEMVREIGRLQGMLDRRK